MARRITHGGPSRPTGDDLRYLRRDGNRLVRARRRRRTTLRWSLLALIWGCAGVAALCAAALGIRWSLAPGRFPVQRVVVKGAVEAAPAEVEALVKEWIGANIFTIDLSRVEAKVREHPWIGPEGAGGTVRMQRRLTGTLVIELQERQAAGLVLLDGALHLVDARGLPIDRHGPRYARYDFPIVKGLEGLALRASHQGGEPARRDLSDAVAAGVAAARALAGAHPALHAQVSEIDVSDPAMLVLRLEDRSYDVRLSREETLRNVDRFIALKGQFEDEEGGGIDYVDLRWRERIAVMPAVSPASADRFGGRQDGGR